MDIRSQRPQLHLGSRRRGIGGGPKGFRGRLDRYGLELLFMSATWQYRQTAKDERGRENWAVLPKHNFSDEFLLSAGAVRANLFEEDRKSNNLRARDSRDF